jgi:nitrite reductase/ring-hydroxylating ferredoxin subunit
MVVTEGRASDQQLDPSADDVRGWFLVALVGEFRRSGDFRTRDVGETSVIVLRDGDHFVVCANECPHEGLPITARHAAGNSVGFVCPFHAWSWDASGRYRRGVAAAERVVGTTSNGSHKDLERFAVAAHRGFVWATRGAGGEPGAQVPPVDGERFGRPSTPTRATVLGGWRAVVDSLRELDGAQAVAGNALLCPTTDTGEERAVVTVTRRHDDVAELTAWTDLDTVRSGDEFDALVRRRRLLQRLGAAQ